MKTQKRNITANPFICMTDLMVSLNAGILVLGIISASDPDLLKLWEQLHWQTAQVEKESQDARLNQECLARRYQALLSESQNRDQGDKAPAGAPQKTLELVNQSH